MDRMILMTTANLPKSVYSFNFFFWGYYYFSAGNLAFMESSQTGLT